jgi:hypothetical protein
MTFTSSNASCNSYAWIEMDLEVAVPFAVDHSLHCNFTLYTILYCYNVCCAGGATAATMPALAAAGLVWQTKNLITKEESSLSAQPSILNWHDLPVDLE